MADVYRGRATLFLPAVAPAEESDLGKRIKGDPQEIPLRVSVRYRGGREFADATGLVVSWDAFYECVRPTFMGPTHGGNVTAWRLRDEDRPGTPILEVTGVDFPEMKGRSLMRIFVRRFARGA